MSASKAVNARETTRRLAELSTTICGQLQERMNAAEAASCVVEEEYAEIIVLGAVVEAMRRRLPPELQRAADELGRVWAEQSLSPPGTAASAARATTEATLAVRAYDACLEPDATATTWAAAESALVDALAELEHSGHAPDAEREWLSRMLDTVRTRRTPPEA